MLGFCFDLFTTLDEADFEASSFKGTGHQYLLTSFKDTGHQYLLAYFKCHSLQWQGSKNWQLCQICRKVEEKNEKIKVQKHTEWPNLEEENV